MPSSTKLSGALLFAGGTTFIIFNTIAEGSYQGYNIGTRALSDLGAIGSPTRFLWDGQLFATGVLGFLGMLVLFSGPALKIGNRRFTGLLYLLPNIGTVLVSLFPENFIPSMHAASAFVVFLFGGIDAVYSYRFTTSPFRYFAVLLGAFSLASIGLFSVAGEFGFGLIERMVVYPYAIWGLAFGGYLMSLPAPQEVSV